MREDFQFSRIFFIRFAVWNLPSYIRSQLFMYMLFRFLLATVALSALFFVGARAAGSDLPDGIDRNETPSSFVAKLALHEGYLPQKLSDLSSKQLSNEHRQIFVLLKEIETDLFEVGEVPNELQWQAVEQLLVTFPDAHLYCWYYRFYKAIAYAEDGFHEKAQIEGEKALGQALAMRADLLLLANFGMLYFLSKENTNYQEALRYMELFNKQEKQLKRNGRILEEALVTEPGGVKSSNSRTVYVWLVLGIALMLGLGWYWLPFKLVWLHTGEENQREQFQTILPSWLAKTEQHDDDVALTDEEIVVDETKVELLAKLRGHKLITNDDWLAFQQLFNRIHPDFLIHLRFKHKGITPAEEKLACMIRVHFSTREIARLLAVSANSVNISRYRLRKRCKLEADTTLEEYLMRY